MPWADALPASHNQKPVFVPEHVLTETAHRQDENPDTAHPNPLPRNKLTQTPPGHDPSLD